MIFIDNKFLLREISLEKDVTLYSRIIPVKFLQTLHFVKIE